MPGAADVIRAAGVCFVRPDGAVLLLRRTDSGNYWAFPGGKIEEGETPADAAAREVTEETGWTSAVHGALAGALEPWTRRIKDGVDFTTFRVSVPMDTPAPVLTEEHDLVKWATPDEAMTEGGIHPGVRVALMRFDADELSLARLMRLGEITSPQRYGNILLVALRITGTGASFRQSLDEYVWRDPSLYLNAEFLARCNGLPVVWEHPVGKSLDSKEFGDRVVGTITLPFVDGDEVWGIAKVYDAEAARLLETSKLSTSPGVVFRALEVGMRLPAEDGKHILVEGKPSLIDHLAICELGVWDKGGPAAGVSNPSTEQGDTTMADEKDMKTDSQKIMDSLAGIHGRLDGMEEESKKDRARVDAMCGRMDAVEEQAKKDTVEEQAKKDAAAAEEKAAKDRKDADDEKAEKDRKDAAAAAGHEDLGKRLKDVESIVAGMNNADVTAFVSAQSRADRAYQVFGDAAAPRWAHGEGLIAYRKRLLQGVQKHSVAFKDVDIGKDVGESMLANAEKVVYADAVTAAMNPSHDTAMVLREIVTTDDAGRKIRTFVGNNELTWGPFKQRVRQVSGFKKPDNR